MAGNPVDPLQTLQAALSVQANSKEQADLLATLRESLENHPAPIPILVGTLIGIVVNAGDSLLKRWVIDLLHFAICRSSLSLEQRTQSLFQYIQYTLFHSFTFRSGIPSIGHPRPTRRRPETRHCKGRHSMP